LVPASMVPLPLNLTRESSEAPNSTVAVRLLTSKAAAYMSWSFVIRYPPAPTVMLRVEAVLKSLNKLMDPGPVMVMLSRNAIPAVFTVCAAAGAKFNTGVPVVDLVQIACGCNRKSPLTVNVPFPVKFGAVAVGEVCTRKSRANDASVIETLRWAGFGNELSSKTTLSLMVGTRGANTPPLFPEVSDHLLISDQLPWPPNQ